MDVETYQINNLNSAFQYFCHELWCICHVCYQKSQTLYAPYDHVFPQFVKVFDSFDRNC